MSGDLGRARPACLAALADAKIPSPVASGVVPYCGMSAPVKAWS